MVNRSGTFTEGNLMKQAGLFTHSLDVGASNLFNNKVFIRESINRVRFKPKEKYKTNNDSMIINETSINSVIGDIDVRLDSNEKENPLISKNGTSKMVILEGANLDSKGFQLKSGIQSIAIGTSLNPSFIEDESVIDRTIESRNITLKEKNAI